MYYWVWTKLGFKHWSIHEIKNKNFKWKMKFNEWKSNLVEIKAECHQQRLILYSLIEVYRQCIEVLTWLKFILEIAFLLKVQACGYVLLEL